MIVWLPAHILHRKGTPEIYNCMYAVNYSLRVYKLGLESVTFSPVDPDILCMDPFESIKIQNIKEENLSTLHLIIDFLNYWENSIKTGQYYKEIYFF